MTVANTEYRELFAPITKMYDGPDGFFVEGTLVAEEPDRTKEIWDYASSKKSVTDWAEDAHRTTGGKSAGNLRAMHGNVAVGKFLRVEPDDSQKLVSVKAEIVDPVDKEKARKGVYSGFSIKAPYARRWPDPKDPRLTRWTSGPIIEGSLVDLPCIKSATFAIKVVGPDKSFEYEEVRRFANYEQPILEPATKSGSHEEEDMTLKEIAEKRGLDPAAFKSAVEDVLDEAKKSAAVKCMKSASECTDSDCSEHKGAKGHKGAGPGGSDASGTISNPGGGEHTPSGDGIKMSDGSVMQPYKNAKGETIYKKETPAVKFADLDTVIAEKMSPFTDALNKLTDVVSAIAARPLPSAVATRSVDKTADGQSDAQKAANASAAPTADKVAALAKDGKPVDAIKMIHQMEPAQVISNRGIAR